MIAVLRVVLALVAIWCMLIPLYATFVLFGFVTTVACLAAPCVLAAIILGLDKKVG